MKMAQLINFEVDVDNEESENCKEVSDDSDLDSLKSFIVDNEEVNNNNVNFIVLLIMLKLILSKL